jgi:hypothetical protein
MVFARPVASWEINKSPSGQSIIQPASTEIKPGKEETWNYVI